MKRLLLYIFCTLSVVSCKQETLGLDEADVFRVDTDYINMRCEGGEAEFVIHSMSNWQISNKSNWIKLSAVHGNEGKKKISVTIDNNDYPQSRTATITVENTLCNLFHDITISQQAKNPYIGVSESSIQSPAEGKSVSVTINANIDYTISSSHSWCKINESKGGFGEKELRIVIDANTNTEARAAKITLNNSEYKITEKIEISQEKFVPEITISTNKLITASDGEKNAVEINSNIMWSATCDADWVMLSNVSGESGKTILDVTTDFNRKTETRSATIIISNSKYGVNKEIAVLQNEFDINRYIYYTSDNGKVLSPYRSDVFGANIVSNTFVGGQGAILFDVAPTAVGAEAFKDCASLTSLSIPESVSWIGSNALYGCTSLKSVIIPDALTWIADSAFMGCTSLMDITIPAGVITIWDYTFSNCSSLVTVTITDSVNYILDYAFYNCSSLTSVTIGKGVTSIGYYTFANCKSLQSIYCKAVIPPTISNDIFDENVSGFKIYVPRTSVEAYKTALVWKKYADNIVEYDF